MNWDLQLIAARILKLCSGLNGVDYVSVSLAKTFVTVYVRRNDKFLPPILIHDEKEYTKAVRFFLGILEKEEENEARTRARQIVSC